MIWCLHGFLGRGADWDGFRPGWRTSAERAGAGDPAAAVVKAPSLFQGAPVGLDLPAWGARFSREVAARDDRPILVGYSLGGRLALHALVAAPALFAGAVIVSAHPGLADEAARRERVAADERWARRFESEAWSSVLGDWNAQAVFGAASAGVTPPRSEGDYDRRALAAALRGWSLGAQADLREALGDVACPVLWVAGARDTKFVALARDAVDRLANATLTVVADAAHRVPWEAPTRFLEATGTFFTDLWRD